jgi:hypothetical protein
MIKNMEKNSYKEKGLEREIEELRERVRKMEVQIGKEKFIEEKEKIVKEEIKKYLEEIQQTPPPVSSKLRDEAQEIEKFSRPEQVGALISLVFEKGIYYAVSVARNLKNPAILDEFHDVLIDRFYEILTEKGILKSP